MKGDATNYPGAYIEFRLTVSPPAESKPKSTKLDPAYAAGGKSPLSNTVRGV